jgi:hypothetical protein
MQHVGEWKQNSHPSVNKSVFVVAQHMLAEKHSCWPRLTTTPRSDIFVHLERFGKNTVEINIRNATGLEGWQWGDIFADGDGVHQWR